MVENIILGFLRGGQPQYGYNLWKLYEKKSGSESGGSASSSFYRELPRLKNKGLIRPVDNPADADERRIPYQITEKGSDVFDRWLTSPLGGREQLTTRLIFADQIPAERLSTLLDRWEEELIYHGKKLARMREAALARRRADASEDYDASPCLLLRRMRHVTAELDFLSEFRADIEVWRAHPRIAPRSRGEGGEKATMRKRTGKTADGGDVGNGD